MRKHAIPLSQVGCFSPYKAPSIKFERASDPPGVVGIRVHTHIARADRFVAKMMSGKWSSVEAQMSFSGGLAHTNKDTSASAA